MTPNFEDAGYPFGSCTKCGHDNAIHIDGKCKHIVGFVGENNSPTIEPQPLYCECVK